MNSSALIFGGADLTESLPARYESSRYCVILQSDEYLKKAWTTLERQAIIWEFLKRRGKDYILPIVVRDCGMKIPGLSGVTGHTTAKSKEDWDGVVEMLFVKLKK